MVLDNKRCTVLVVDDTPENVDLLNGILEKNYNVKVALNGKKALKIAQAQEKPDIILLDIMMPDMNGYEVCQTLKGNPDTEKIPIIFITAMSEVEDEEKGLAMGAVDYITKPVSPPIVLARVKNHLDLKKYRDSLEDMVQERTKELLLTQEVTIESLGTLAEYRDPETGGHIKRTQNYVRVLAEHLKHHPKFTSYLNEDTISLLYKSAPLHDVGKVGVPDKILHKPGKLEPEEFDEMKKHTIYGFNAMKRAELKLGFNSFLRLAGEIAYTHQEKWDGSGYPQGLAGEEIPISGRLMAIADVYDALISKRVYKPPFSHEKAVAIIREGKGKHFDPEMVDVFLEVSEEFREIAIHYADYAEEREILSRCDTITA